MSLQEPDQSQHQPNGAAIFVGVLFILFGILFLVIPHSSSRQGMYLLLGLVNIVVGIIKIARGVGGGR